jgi:energy-coupling factor transporter ATP-binding protein EcfA2
MSMSTSRPPMYFASLEIENIKCFEGRQFLDLCDSNGNISPWTLILGNNGIGKTTLLKCLAWMVPVEVPARTDAGPNAGILIKPSMDDHEDETEFDRLIRVGNDVNANIKVNLTNGVGLREPVSQQEMVSIGMEFERVKGKLTLVEPAIASLAAFNTTSLFAYGANRHMGKRNYDQSDLKNPVFNLFSDFGDLYDARQVLATLDYASLKEKGEGKATDLFKKVKEILADLLPDLEDLDAIHINSPVNPDGILGEPAVGVETPYGEVPLSELSLGYKTMLAWTLDLAIRMAWNYQDSDRPLEQPAVVLMDEIDLHLHPKWQRIVRVYLLRHFPRTQFICTAHSPFMAQASEDENLCVLDRVGHEVRIENNPSVVKGWRIGQVVTSDLFDIEGERSKEVENMVIRRRTLLDKQHRTTTEEQTLRQLDEELSKLPVADRQEDQNMLDQLRQATEVLRREGRLQ